MSAAPNPNGNPEGGMFAADFDELRRGDAFESMPRPIGEHDVAVFGALTGDQHPIHVDPEWAARGPFGRPIAHGLLLLSCAVGSLPLDPERVLALRRIGDAVFKRPLEVGDSIVVGCKVTELKPLDERTGLVGCEWRIAGSDGRLRVRAKVEILWRRTPAPAGETAFDELRAGLGVGDSQDELAPVLATEDGLRVLV